MVLTVYDEVIIRSTLNGREPNFIERKEKEKGGRKGIKRIDQV